MLAPFFVPGCVVSDFEELEVMLAMGRSTAALIVCAPIWLLPTMTMTPTLGVPLTTTNIITGPGARMAAFGGIWLTCRVALPSPLNVPVQPFASQLWAVPQVIIVGVQGQNFREVPLQVALPSASKEPEHPLASQL